MTSHVERPILFSAPMVRALLAGTKTQTRRRVKNADPLHLLTLPDFTPADVAHPKNGFCPYGYPGDTLWVRESWCAADAPNGFAYMADAPGYARGLGWRPSIYMPRVASRITLRLTAVRVERLQDISRADTLAEGIYRVDPYQDDLAAGCTPEDFVFMVPGSRQGWGMTKEERARERWMPTAESAYRVLWEGINGEGSWDANPWVWAVSFDVENR